MIAMCLPDFDKACEKIEWGVAFSDLVHGLSCTLDVLNVKKFCFVAHDWGSIVAQLYENKYPDRISKIVLLDVGRGVDPTPRGRFVFIFFQISLAIIYVLFKIFGHFLGNLIFRSFERLIPRSLRAIPYDAKYHPPADTMDVHLCYPYIYLWFGICTFGYWQTNSSFPPGQCYLCTGNTRTVCFTITDFLRSLTRILSSPSFG